MSSKKSKATKKEEELKKMEDSKNKKTEHGNSEPVLESPDVKDQGGIKTIGSMMGEAVWLMSQSQEHKYLALADLEWLLMPPIIFGQYKLFRNADKKPMGVALWGYLSEEAEKKLKAAGRLAPQDWGNNACLDTQKGLIPNEGGTLWLVELIAPFHDEKNKHREQILSDLLATVLKGKSIKMMHMNPKTGKREVVVLGEKLA